MTRNSDDAEKKVEKHRGDAWHVDKRAWRSETGRVDKNMMRAKN